MLMGERTLHRLPATGTFDVKATIRVVVTTAPRGRMGKRFEMELPAEVRPGEWLEWEETAHGRLSPVSLCYHNSTDKVVRSSLAGKWVDWPHNVRTAVTESESTNPSS